MSNDNVWQCSHQSSLWYWRALCCFPCFTHPITALFFAEVICESFGVPSNLDYCLGQDSGAEWSTGISFDFPTELQGAGRNNLPVASRPSRPVSAAPWWRAMPTVTEGRWRGRRAALSSGLVPGVPAGSYPPRTFPFAWVRLGRWVLGSVFSARGKNCVSRSNVRSALEILSENLPSRRAVRLSCSHVVNTPQVKFTYAVSRHYWNLI